MKSRSGTLIQLTLATLLLLPSAIYADTLVLTENSSTDLTVTLGGSTWGTVVNQSPDHWTWDFAGLDNISMPFGTISWREPNASPTDPNPLSNSIWMGTSPGGAYLNIASENTYSDGQLWPDSTTVAGALFLGSGASGGLTGYYVQFVDNGDSSTVPDVTPTWELLAIAFLGVMGVRRRRFFRA